MGNHVLVDPWSERWWVYQQGTVRAMRWPPGLRSPQFLAARSKRTLWGPAPRTVHATPEPVWKRKLEKQFDKRISLDFHQAAIKEMIGVIAGLIDATIVLDPKAGEDRHREATIRLEKVSAQSALDYLCLATGLRWSLKDEAVFLTTAEEVWPAPAIGIVWMTRMDRIAANPTEARDFARFVTTVLRASTTWDDKVCWVAARPGYHLEVYGLLAHHRFLGAVCRGLRRATPGQHRRLPDPAEDPEEAPILTRLLAQEVPADVARPLAGRAELELENVPLSDAVSAIAAKAKTTILVRPDDPLSEKKITLQGEGLRLEEALRQVEDQAGAMHLPLTHGLLVVSREEAEALAAARWTLYHVPPAAEDDANAEEVLERLRAAAKERAKELGEWPGFFAARWKRCLLVRGAASREGEERF